MFKILIYMFFFVFILVECNYAFYSVSEKQIQVGIDEKLDNTLPAGLSFIDADGNTVYLDSIINKPTVLALVYYNCPSICSPLLMGVAEVAERVDLKAGEEYQIITVSFDGSETFKDAAKWKKEHINSLGDKFPEGSWRFLTGDSVNISGLTEAVGFHFKPEKDNNFAHPAAVIVLSPSKRVTRYIFGTSFLPFDIKMAVIEASKEKSSPTINKMLDFCFSYERESNKYVFNFNKVAGSIILFSIIIFLSILILKGKVKKENQGI